MGARAAGRRTGSSRVEMTEIVLPADTNHYGHVWGGRVMALIDKAAAIAAIRHCRTSVVTASVDSLVFLAPVKLSHILSLYASVNAAFHTSLEVGVKVVSEDPRSGRQSHCCSAYVTMVSLDAAGRPAAVPPVVTTTREDRQRLAGARRRRRQRLMDRQRRRERPVRLRTSTPDPR